MNCLPVIEMELRSAARKKSTVGLRVLFASVSVATALVVLVTSSLSSDKGMIMIEVLSFLCMAFCLLAGGFLTADCVSREKREGTLGLLFLTPLSGMDIVLGKLFCHSLQMAYGVCAVFPVFFLSLFVGGVTGGEVVRILLALGLTLLLGASVGMVISVTGVDSRRTMLATFGSLLLLTGLPMLFWMASRFFSRSGGGWDLVAGASPVFAIWSGLDVCYHTYAGAQRYWGAILVLLAISLTLTMLAGLLLPRVFRAMAGGQDARVQAPMRKGPRWSGILDRNPYEWLVLRCLDSGGAWRRLLGLLVLLVVVAAIVSVNTTHYEAAFCTAFFTAVAVHWLIKLQLALGGTRQIRYDCESGAFELLWVTTLSRASFLQGHRRAMRTVATRLLLLLLLLNLGLEACVVFFPESLHTNGRAGVGFTCIFMGGMVQAWTDLSALRWIAFYQGMRSASHLKAVMATMAMLMLPPWIGFGLMVAALGRFRGDDTVGYFFIFWTILTAIYDLLLIVYCRWRLKDFTMKGALR
jgi:ABC-type transport system involved in multi-copper enzyme maturation permease subunit